MERWKDERKYGRMDGREDGMKDGRKLRGRKDT
jgi:hypothetical protein